MPLLNAARPVPRKKWGLGGTVWSWFSGMFGPRKGSWYVHEPFKGAWQQNRIDQLHVDTPLAHPALFACLSLISSDVGKLRPKLISQTSPGVWEEITNATHSPVLARPNHYQNHIQFKETWILSKLQYGNTYVLKQRDNRGGENQGGVRALYVLDPCRVKVRVSPDGSIFYELSPDDLSGVQGTIVPASEIVHDRMNTLFHPLCGISPIFAAALSSHVGLAIERNSAGFFINGSNPSGLLSTDAEITQEQADEASDRWRNTYSRERSGEVAVLGMGMKFMPLRMSSIDAQLIEQLQFSSAQICSAFRVPGFKVGVGPRPAVNNAEITDRGYYSDCLQSYIEAFEASMDEAFSLPPNRGIELDIDGLLRMDQKAQMETLTIGVKGVLSADEARRKLGLPPTEGGEAVLTQVQNFSLAALAKRDAKDDPFATAEPATHEEGPEAEEEEEEEEQEQRSVDELLQIVELCEEAVCHS